MALRHGVPTYRDEVPYFQCSTPASEAREVGTNRRLRILYLRSRATLAAWRQETKQAADYLEEAVTLAEEIGLPGEVGQMQAKLSELYR